MTSASASSRGAVLALLAVLAALAVPAAAAQAGERVRLSFAFEGAGPGAGAAVQVYDSRGDYIGCHVPFTSESRCTDTTPTFDVVATGTAVVIDEPASAGRCLRVIANDTDAAVNLPSPTSVTATFTDPDGTQRTVGPLRMENGAQIYVGSSPLESALMPGGAPPLMSQCVDVAPRDNRAPVAVGDLWTVKPGLNVDETVLANDYDPDGDPIKARVLSISFASKEWSGMEPDGSFLYVAGPGTSRVLNKRITYVAVDDKGLESAPAVATVRIEPPKKAKKKPIAKKSAVAAPTWEGPSHVATLCFGVGLDTRCFTMLSVVRTRELDGATAWTTLDQAATACLRFGLLPMKNRRCAAELVSRGAGQVWDKSVIHNAVRFRNCLLFQVERNRTPKHPIVGEWTKPHYHPTNSLVKPYSGNARFSGYGYWARGILPGKKWRVPLFCDRNGRVYRQVYQDLVAVK